MKDQPRKIVVWLPQYDRQGISNNQLLFSFGLKCLVTITPGYHIVTTTNPSTGYYSVKTLVYLSQVVLIATTTTAGTTARCVIQQLNSYEYHYTVTVIAPQP